MSSIYHIILAYSFFILHFHSFFPSHHPAYFPFINHFISSFHHIIIHLTIRTHFHHVIFHFMYHSSYQPSSFSYSSFVYSFIIFIFIIITHHRVIATNLASCHPVEKLGRKNDIIKLMYCINIYSSQQT